MEKVKNNLKEKLEYKKERERPSDEP